MDVDDDDRFAIDPVEDPPMLPDFRIGKADFVATRTDSRERARSRETEDFASLESAEEPARAAADRFAEGRALEGRATDPPYRLLATCLYTVSHI
ncbi:MAG: hypothetical protein A3E78_11720 [Alphaproteobacteria bacterium RIFCSPHIGHO2_12_FULL_63_12]|nr:MAG: hypothetical protein A3E78_11720 [Alphaproteobacteria bacterium RIFCSPHIGHO2_12_FULL_63_12]